MNRVPHPALAHWMRQAGTPASSAALWQSMRQRLDGLANGLDGLSLFKQPWRALDELPWVGSAVSAPPPAGAIASASAAALAQAQTQARLQALLQQLSPATAAVAAAATMAPAGSVADAAAAVRRWAPPPAAVAGALQGATQGASWSGAADGLPAVGPAAIGAAARGAVPSPGKAPTSGRRPAPPAPRQPPGPALSPVAAATAAAHWLQRATRAGLDVAFHSPLGQAVQAGVRRQPGSGRAGRSTHQVDLTQQALDMLGWSEPGVAAPQLPTPPGWTDNWMDQVLRPVGVPQAGTGARAGDGGSLGGLLRHFNAQNRAAAWAGDDASDGVASSLQRQAALVDTMRQLAATSGGPGRAQPAARSTAPAPHLAAVADGVRSALGAVGGGLGPVGQLTGLRGLAQRAMQATSPPTPAGAGVVQPAGPAESAASPARRPAGLAARGPADGEAGAPSDDQQLLLQLARVLRREAERDGIDLSDTAA